MCVCVLCCVVVVCVVLWLCLLCCGYVVVVLDAIFQAECLCQQTLRVNCAGALDGKELFTIKNSEKWRSTSVRTDGARKMQHFTAENPDPTAPNPRSRRRHPNLHHHRRVARLTW